MAASSHRTEQEIQVMPGSFEPQDYLDLHDDPFDVLAQIQDAWRSRELPVPWSAANLPEWDLTGVHWHAYGPPSALQRTPGVISEELLSIVNASIASVTAQAEEENQRVTREKEQEESRTLAAAIESREAQKRSKENYLPIIIVDDPLVRHEANQEDPRPDGQSQSKAEREDDLIITATGLFELADAATADKSTRRAEAVQAVAQEAARSRAFGLRKRFFNRSAQKAEASSAGSPFDSWRRRLAGVHSHAKQQAKQAGQAIIKPVESYDNDKLEECVSCLDDFPPNQLIKVPCHNYCHDCFSSLISISLQNEQQWPPKCCLNEIPFRTILKYTSKEIHQQYKDRASEWNIPISDRIYCGHADCSLWIKPDHINPALRQGRCDRGHWTCTICRSPEHGNNDCPQDRDMTLTNQLADEEGWKRCFQCKALVEHKEACHHMTCRCGTQFCYVCCRRWRTCSCTMDQLHALKAGAQTRRQERLDREQAEAEELRQMLAEIEEFEREEARKAELLRQEQIRQEEERQQRELEERVRQESVRRKEVEMKFTELRSTLGQLHELQRVMVRTEQTKEAESLEDESREAKDLLEKEQAAERDALRATMKAKLSQRDADFHEDFAARAVTEKEIMDNYHAQLVAFYRDKPRGPQEIEKAMFPQRQKMENQYRAWKRWKEQEMEAYQQRLEEEHAIQDELMYSKKQRLVEKYEESSYDLTRRGLAEKHWFCLVVLERERLLAELETQEMDGDADSLFAADASISEVARGERAGSASEHRPGSSSTMSVTLSETEVTVERESDSASIETFVLLGEDTLMANPWIGEALTVDQPHVLPPKIPRKAVARSLGKATGDPLSIGMAY